MLANIDAPELPRPLVKWSAEPLAARDVPRTISQAAHLAALAPAGPVYVSVPYDDWAQDAGPAAAHLAARRTTTAGGLPPGPWRSWSRRSTRPAAPSWCWGPTSTRRRSGPAPTSASYSLPSG